MNFESRNLKKNEIASGKVNTLQEFTLGLWVIFSFQSPLNYTFYQILLKQFIRLLILQ